MQNMMPYEPISMRLPEHLFLPNPHGLDFDFNSPLPRLRLERQMESGEDCLSAESASSAAAQMRR